MAKKLGTLIKEARTGAGLTQEALAKKVNGVTASDISKAERNEKELTQTQLKQIAKACGVTQSSLLNAAKETTAKKTTTKKVVPASEKKTTTAKKTAASSSASSSVVAAWPVLFSSRVSASGVCSYTATPMSLNMEMTTSIVSASTSLSGKWSLISEWVR